MRLDVEICEAFSKNKMRLLTLGTLESRVTEVNEDDKQSPKILGKSGGIPPYIEDAAIIRVDKVAYRPPRRKCPSVDVYRVLSYPHPAGSQPTHASVSPLYRFFHRADRKKEFA